MANATRYYCSREAVKRVAGIGGARLNSQVDSYVEAASEHVESVTGRRFIPITETRYYPWPQKYGNSLVLFLDEDLLAATTVQVQAQDASPTTITSFFLEPINKPPYRRIEIDLSGTEAFLSGDTSQRSISVLGRWAYSETTKAAGTVASGLAASAAATSMVCSDGSLIDVGDTLLIGSEQVFVSEKATVDTTANLAAGISDNMGDVTLNVNTGTLVKVNEVVQVDSERMLVTDITGNDLTVERAYDGTQLAPHTGTLDVYALRTLTIVRGVNGTTAATHADATAITKYVPPADIVNFCRAKAIHDLKQGESGWTGQIGGGDGGVTIRQDIKKMEDDLVDTFGLVTI